jgi:hypothetical protein
MLDGTSAGKKNCKKKALANPRKMQRKPLLRSQIPSQKPRKLKKHPR